MQEEIGALDSDPENRGRRKKVAIWAANVLGVVAGYFFLYPFLVCWIVSRVMAGQLPFPEAFAVPLNGSCYPLHLAAELLPPYTAYLEWVSGLFGLPF